MNWDDIAEVSTLYHRIGEYLELIEKYKSLCNLIEDDEVEVKNSIDSITISTDYLEPVIDETEGLIEQSLNNLKKDYGN